MRLGIGVLGQADAGLMHEPENGRIGFAGKMEICCAPPYQTLDFSLKAKERNSGVIILYSSWSVQVTFARRRWNSVAKSGDSVRSAYDGLRSAYDRLNEFEGLSC